MLTTVQDSLKKGFTFMDLLVHGQILATVQASLVITYLTYSPLGLKGSRIYTFTNLYGFYSTECGYFGETDQ